MARILFIPVILVAMMLSCCDQPENVSDTGTIVFVGLEGGFYGIVDDHNRCWDSFVKKVGRLDRRAAEAVLLVLSEMFAP